VVNIDTQFQHSGTLSLPNTIAFSKPFYKYKFASFDRICFLFTVSKVRSFFKYWLPVLIWMALIFSASSDNKSFQHSSRIIGPLLRWLFPHISEHTVDWVVLVFRKCAHLTEYAVFGFLCWRALRKPVKNDLRSWSWKEAGLAVFLVALYAGSDEFHQSFVPGRDASIRDVMIDTIGGIVGLLFLWAVGRWRKWRGGIGAG
jgi:VanZ family protein